MAPLSSLAPRFARGAALALLLAGCAAPTPAPPPFAAWEPGLADVIISRDPSDGSPVGSLWGPLHPVYVPIARRIVARVVALADRFPSLADARPARLHLHEEPKLFLRWGHEHGVRYVPNPEYNPNDSHSAVGPTISVHDPPLGLSLDLYFFEGPWTDLTPRTPIPVGQMNIVLIVYAPDRALEQALAEAITAILKDEREKLDAEQPGRPRP